MQKIVHYEEYCHKCKFFNFVDWDDPCSECLNNPGNEDSHKPLYFKPNSDEVKKASRRSTKKDA